MQQVEPIGDLVPSRRKAFTLLELLVVIGIIGVLTTLLILGVRSVVRSSKEKATRAHMENLKNLVAERQNTGGMQPIYDLYNASTTTSPPYPNGQPLLQPSKMPGNTPIAIPLNVGAEGGDRFPSFKLAPPAAPDPQNEMARTVLVMTLLRSVPANAKMLAQLPTDSFLNPPPPVASMPPNAPPIPIDGWGNPMIFVPGGGISSTAGVYTTGTNGTPQAATIRSPDGKGFWVSAGPDGFIGGYYDKNGNGTPDAGDVAYGDDNIYSFEN